VVAISSLGSGEGPGRVTGPGYSTRTGAIGQPLQLEAESRQPNQERSQPDDGKEEPDSAPQGEYLGLEICLVQAENLGGNDGPRTTTDPTGRGRAWNAEVLEQARVALLADEVAHSVIIGMPAGGIRHESSST
jgi:hypothetical protein